MTTMQGRAIATHVNRFLKQKSDHDWLMVTLNGKSGKDEFKNIVVYSTFSSNVNRDDFAHYVDTTFCDLSDITRRKLKGLFIPDRHSFQEEDIDFDYGKENGKIGARLLQVVSEKNASNQLEILVGVISLTRTPSVGHHFRNEYWKSDKERVKKGLQFVFAREAQNEIC